MGRDRTANSTTGLSGPWCVGGAGAMGRPGPAAQCRLTPGASYASGHRVPRGLRAASNGTTTLLPHLLATRFSQQKIFQDEFSIAGSKRRTANPARYFAVAGLRSGFGSDDLIQPRACGRQQLEEPCPTAQRLSAGRATARPSTERVVSLSAQSRGRGALRGRRCPHARRGRIAVLSLEIDILECHKANHGHRGINVSPERHTWSVSRRSRRIRMVTSDRDDGFPGPCRLHKPDGRCAIAKLRWTSGCSRQSAELPGTNVYGTTGLQ